MAKTAPIVLVAVTTLSALAAAVLAAGDEGRPTATGTAIARFSDATLGVPPRDWKFLPVRNVKHATQYAIVRDDEAGVPVLEGIADNAAGALTQRLDADAAVTPMLRFRWRVGSLISRSDPTTKAGDDYAARIYVTFAYDPARATLREKSENAIMHMLYGETPPHAALAYVFTHKLATGAVQISPFTSRVRKIVVDSDVASVGKWKQFERNVLEDYRRVFREEPTAISGIAVMVDTDNTGEHARSRFGDITLTAK